MDRNLRALSIGAAVRALGVSLFGPFLALYLHNVLSIGFALVGALLFLFGAVSIPFAVAGGLLTDRRGRRPVFLWTLVGEVAAVAAMGWSMSVSSLLGVVAAALAGSIITSLGNPANSAYIADLAEGHERTQGFMWQRIGHNAGFAAGAAAGGLLIAALGFARVVYLGTMVLLVSTSYLALVLAPSREDRRIKMGLGGAAPTGGVPRRPPLGASLRAIARDRTFLEFTIGMTLIAVVTGQWNVVFPLFVNSVMHVSYGWLGLGLSLNGVLVVVAQPWTTRVARGHRHTLLANLGLLLYVAGFLLLAAAGALALFPLEVFFGVVFLLTMGENTEAIPYSTLPSNLSPLAERGAYNGAFSALTGFGYLLATLWGGAGLSLFTNPLLLWTVLMLPAVPAFVLLARVGRRISTDIDHA
ncbi:MAG: MFS transporter [Euryarchaeota archaeon]|nr:MFS transporter [Euryarchaeota archaeon]MDE1836843.1 MFS transporter [Euryarchaeota archaeon]MDE1879722.1 MFS transporter [Euryarchaeota archaeon]MDE2046055.1 MFS transporter [Thermoplasmata archaeon]